ncbi:BTB/POZ domain protein [Aspergillus campestris IBT 28561]|uniref:BTB/POZ domain protein n=1 Tax=Aspergillus campestris (strain IBT 28561) TaxID=1392248 RepID=A0A2I1DC77_ASPC2|nr:BTB/POZ domain protein [Aspergillus campestris IBT 28561]PKY07468.1 BTB/POZ domain protein [Aspergillus campestris IBT 28561]
MGNDEPVGIKFKAETLEAEGKEGDLTASIQRYFHTSTFSDLTIVTSDQRFEVHKLIVCGQSGYFSNLFKHNWKEVTDNVIRLEEDDPRAVEAMIHFMYGFNYDSSGSDRGRTSPMLFNVNVYQTGDKYDIPKLKEQAKEKFAVALKNCWEMDDFPVAIARAYSTTVASDRGLRDLLVDTCLEHIDDLLEDDDFKQVLRETLDFAADLVQKQIYHSDKTIYRCPSCRREWSVTCTTNAVSYCPMCSSNQDWSRHVKK